MANPKGNPQNLIPNLPPEKQPTQNQRKKNASKAGKASAKAKKDRKTLKEELLLLLSEGDVQERMSTALIDAVLNGNVRAFEIIRDTIGEKPRDELEIGNLDDKPFETLDLSRLSSDELQALLAKK